MPTTLVTGKTCTFQYGTVQGEAQITTFSTEESGDSESIETLTGTAVLSSSKSYTATVQFLFDGNTVSGERHTVYVADPDGMRTEIACANCGRPRR